MTQEANSMVIMQPAPRFLWYHPWVNDWLGRPGLELSTGSALLTESLNVLVDSQSIDSTPYQLLHPVHTKVSEV